MQQVGHHLQVYAHRSADPDRALFARSAYNRYYYGCFLILRQALSEMEPAWSAQRHKSYPETLEGQVRRRLKRERGLAAKAGDADLIKAIDAALYAIRPLCEIIREANAARLVADYEPSIPVVFDGVDRFSLNEIQVTRAHEWNNKIQVLIASVLAAWRQIDV